MAGSVATILGRDAELAALREVVAVEEPQRMLVLSGDPGIGKTTLWEAGVAIAREEGVRVLRARASAAEERLSYAGLSDLLDGVELDHLPPPQRSALEVALLREEPGRVAPEPRAVALGLTSVVRSLAAAGPLVVAIDDVQWLDRPSEDALVFATRRLDREPVTFLVARRRGRPCPLERAVAPRRPEQLEVGPLTFGAVRRLLFLELGLSLPRHVLRRVVDLTLGNPLFALELGRTLQEDGVPAVGEELPVPDEVEDLLGTRVARLPSGARRLLLALALGGDLRRSELEAIDGPDAVGDALARGVLVVDGERTRPSHPLLAAAAGKRSRASARRELHVALARVVGDEERRARHLALAAHEPDESLAELVARAAAAASARGARREAVELGEHALRLTPNRSEARVDRLLALAGYSKEAGERRRVTDLLLPEVDSLPHGTPRVRALLLLTDGEVKGNDEIRAYLARALGESGSDPGLRATVLAELAQNDAVIRVERIRAAESWALESVRASRTVDASTEARALYALAWPRSLRGRPVDDLCERFRAATDAAIAVSSSPDRVAGQRLVWRGDVGRARRALERLLTTADERGEGAAGYTLARLHVCELELRIGDWAAAERLLDEWAQSADVVIWPMYERCRALLAAGRGLSREAAKWSEKAIELAEATGVRWDVLESRRARGMAALLEHEPARASEMFCPVWDHMLREGVDEPGAFPVAPELVEALVELGQLDEARAVTARLRACAEEQDHPWALVTARRCGALTCLAAAHDDVAVDELRAAAGEYGELGLAFERGRTLLAAGRLLRRRRKWGAARDVLEQATAAFEAIGSTGWAADARSELARVGARRPQRSGGLTVSERRVAELAAAGLSNKEVAQQLVVSVHTVEVHLSHVYAKLGVRSRVQLAQHLPRG